MYALFLLFPSANGLQPVYLVALWCLSSKVMKKSSMKPGGTESVWCQLGKTSVILVHWFMLIQSPNPKLPNLYVFIGTNPKQPQLQLQHPPPQHPPPPWAARRLLDFDETFGYRCPLRCRHACQSSWALDPSSLEIHGQLQWCLGMRETNGFSCPLRRPYFLAKKG